MADHTSDNRPGEPTGRPSRVAVAALGATLAIGAALLLGGPFRSGSVATDGDITVVEFFDYNCGYCKRGFHSIRELIEKDKNVRVVFKELPILSKDSEDAAKIALAARAQGKYWELHQALIESKGRATEASALEMAGKLGLDVAKLKADKDSEAVKGELARVEALARTMNISGTPHFLVGDQAIGGAPEDLLDQLTGKIAALRQSGCAYC